VIESYSFGRIVVDGRTYTADVIICPDRVESSWVRGSGHALAIEDLQAVLEGEARMVIVGTGSVGLMRVPVATLEYLKAAGFEVIVERTGQACDTYNRLSEQRPVIAALHLSC
jgi:hypothetical protein